VLFRNGQLSSSLKHLLKAFIFIESMGEKHWCISKLGSRDFCAQSDRKI
jgi:hypothetical protein